jgi:hypothetical protein
MRVDAHVIRNAGLMVVGVASVAGAKTAEMFFLDRRTIQELGLRDVVARGRDRHRFYFDLPDECKNAK